MGLFKKKKDNEAEKADSLKEKKVGEVKASDKDSNVVNVEKKGAKKTLISDIDGVLAYKFVVKPWITEKTHELMSTDKYVFKIRKGIAKNQVRNAIEKLYGVTVIKINIINIHAKKRRFGRVIGKKSAIRKAIVTLKKGDKIEVFE